MSVKGLSRRGTAICYDVDLGEMLSDTSSLSFSYLLSNNKDVYYEDFLTESQVMNFYKRKSDKSVIPINEATRKEILKEADYARKQRAKKLTTKYAGVTNANGWIKFVTNSQYTPGIKYTQYIKLAEAGDMKYFKEFNKKDIIRLFLSGDLKVHCTCPDFRYRQKYMAYNLGYGIFKETRFPKIRNPRLEGSVCKHLICVLSVVGTNWTSIAKDMKKTKFFKRKYEDEEYMKELDNKKKYKSSGKK